MHAATLLEAFSRLDDPPCATTISRALAKRRVAEFQAALSVWMQATGRPTAWSPWTARPPGANSKMRSSPSDPWPN